MTAIRVVVAGAAGRMGIANIKAILNTPDMVVSGALDQATSPAIGKDAGTLAGTDPIGVAITADPDVALAEADAIIDFTTPATSVTLAKLAAARGLVHVIGTTGCSDNDEAELRTAAAAGARIVKSGNMSLGVNILVSLVRKAAAALGPEFDAEILEMHHNKKVDAPSGTALMLGEAVAEGRNIDFAANAVKSREGITGPRQQGSIGFATLRGGNVVGDHTVMLVGPNERIELTHIAQDRALFANGAVRAAAWAFDKAPGYYSMADVLGLND